MLHPELWFVHPSFELGIYLRFRDDHGVASELHIWKTKTHHWEGRLYRELGDVDGDVVSRAIETLIQSCTNILITRPNNIIPDMYDLLIHWRYVCEFAAYCMADSSRVVERASCNSKTFLMS